MSLMYRSGENPLEVTLAQDAAARGGPAARVPRSRSDAGVPSKALDKLDLLILEVLQRDVTIPVFDLAEKVHSSKSVVWRRIQQMVEAGVIRERIAVVHPRSVGFNVLVFVRVRMVNHGQDCMARFAKAMLECPEVLECHTLLGDVDFLLKVVARSLDDYQDFFVRKLARVEGVREVTSSVAMNPVVSTTQLPLRWLASASGAQAA